MIAPGGIAHSAIPLSVLLATELPGAEVAISGVQLDSRAVQPGDLFLAVPGDVYDGRQFIEQALANGAKAVAAQAPVEGFVDALAVPLIELPELHLECGAIASRFYANPSSSLHMVGITGTNGKTTTTRLVAQLYRALGKSCGTIGTLGATTDDSASDALNTTPDPVSLQRQLAQWRDAGIECVSMEVSSHALSQGRVNGVSFNAAVYTNLSRDHLDYHGTMESYARSKAQLFGCSGLQFAIVNLDDDYAGYMLASLPSQVSAFTYSACGHTEADLRIEQPVAYRGGMRATMHSPWGSADFVSPLPGDFNLANVAAAVAVLVLSGENFTAVLSAVTDLKPVPGRMQSIPNTLGLQVIVDYAHTPDALEQVLESLRVHTTGSLVTVVGCGGDRDRGKRSVMGRIASELSDHVILTSDNPRSEDPLAILRDMEAGCVGSAQLLVDRAAAIENAICSAQKGDCILIAGKGHESYQLIDGQRLHFSDAEQALAALRGRAAL